eukprot:CAMPEP_0204046252 /NCGR_PEP_ID=MMETSP0360-20130528/110097_1 /ASSEMBLY_ACC=CAM_ASM_000342 /TAXON_ID=268821 /ORGANISM="Scrippsiella Hangoei, Strain SHTV-5" /LENGTH=54 /DNA_ID=CAMNT_0050992841 /DNA_START=31 /DNA_END=192 /DNA_ORIENTATION=+
MIWPPSFLFSMPPSGNESDHSGASGMSLVSTSASASSPASSLAPKWGGRGSGAR